ncbi:3-hydroxyacyl-CoA dehydrogenase [bacterium]|nr:3-hydroxyacyl-CoA dehydrogenase [bacterium]
MTAVTQDLDADGILTLTIDLPNRSMNVINAEFGEGFEPACKRAIEDDAVKGIVITSAKDSFVAGADIDMIFPITDAKQAEQAAKGLAEGLRALETCGKPVAAAMNGTALGGGLEICLACHYRVAIDNPRAKIGLPEVKLGLLPGAGGTQRLPRMIGIQASLPLILEGKELDPAKAKSMGIVDDLASDRDDMMAKAKAWVKATPKAAQPWDQKGFKYPGGDAKNPKMGQVLAIAPSMLRDKTKGNYPAPENILSCVVEGSLVDFDSAMTVEARYFANCVVSQVSKNMIGTLWYQLNAIKRGASRPDGFEPYKTKKVGILGAGMMGAGIAYVSAKAGIDVVLKDVSQQAADKGKAYSESLQDKAIKRGRSTPEKKAELLGRITATDSYDGMADCDLIIEAVFEDRGLKAKVTQDTEAVLPETATFASNTSTLPITGLAEASKRPEQFIGLHFFSPADKMPLVEIIKGEQTNPETLAKAFDYVLQIRKTPIVVNDSRGFYTSRVFATYVNEGMAMLAEGVPPMVIERAGLQAGMPVGPLALHDEVSLSLSWHIMEQTRKDFEAEGKEFPKSPGYDVVDKMVNTLERPGKKAGKGFYDYPDGGKKAIWSGLAEHFPRNDDWDFDTLVERFGTIQANETARCMEEDVVETVADANIGSIFGWGFAPHEGGTLQYINARGLQAFVDQCKAFAKDYGPRFEPAELLVKMAADGKQFEA